MTIYFAAELINGLIRFVGFRGLCVGNKGGIGQQRLGNRLLSCKLVGEWIVRYDGSSALMEQ
jgi:hypothetical protein